MLKTSFDRQKHWETSPRVTSLVDAFEAIAAGHSGYPSKREVTADLSLFGGREDILAFHERYMDYTGTFNAHFLASIPYVLEEECRLGNAMSAYLTGKSRNLRRMTHLQTVGNAEAVIARTVVAHSGGHVASLSNSPTEANLREFERNRPADCHFHLGPYFELDRHRIRNTPELARFHDGFDIIYEDTAFQMYGPDRHEQVPFVLQNLRRDGIFVCLEKCSHASRDEYLRRERVKDREFKSRYFDDSQLEEKEFILSEMVKGQVPLEHVVDAIRIELRYVEMVWNSGNFYMLAASDDWAELQAFKALLGPVCIPDAYVFDFPRSL